MNFAQNLLFAKIRPILRTLAQHVGMILWRHVQAPGASLPCGGNNDQGYYYLYFEALMLYGYVRLYCSHLQWDLSRFDQCSAKVTRCYSNGVLLSQQTLGCHSHRSFTSLLIAANRGADLRASLLNSVMSLSEMAGELLRPRQKSSQVFHCKLYSQHRYEVG